MPVVLEGMFRLSAAGTTDEAVWFEVSQNKGLRKSDGNSVLSPGTKPFQILMLLLRNATLDPNHVTSKEELLREVWEVEHLSDGTFNGTICDLRTALGDIE